MATNSDSTARYSVGDLIVEVGTQRVTRNGGEITLPELSFQLLLTLIEAAPNTLSIDELIELNWSGAPVSPETVAQCVQLLRDALGDDPEKPAYIESTRGRGYCLIPTVTQLTERAPKEGLFKELVRRRVPQTAIIYLAVGWGFTQLAIAFSESLRRYAMILFLAGFPVVMYLAWTYDLRLRTRRLVQAAVVFGLAVVVAHILLPAD